MWEQFCCHYDSATEPVSLLVQIQPRFAEAIARHLLMYHPPPGCSSPLSNPTLRPSPRLRVLRIRRMRDPLSAAPNAVVCCTKPANTASGYLQRCRPTTTASPSPSPVVVHQESHHQAQMFCAPRGILQRPMMTSSVWCGTTAKDVKGVRPFARDHLRIPIHTFSTRRVS